VKLYELNNHYRQLLENGFAFDEETGEVLWEGEKGFEELEAVREEKIIACAKVFAEMRAEREAYSEQRKALAKRMMAHEAMLEKREEALRLYIERNTLAVEKFGDGLITIGWRKSSSIEITVAPETLPLQYVQIKQTFSPDRTALKNAIQGGALIAGVELVEKNNLQIK